MSAYILTFPGNPGAPVQPFVSTEQRQTNLYPRQHFGLRPPMSGALPYIRRAARNAADILSGADVKRANIHPDLHRALAVQLEQHAEQGRLLAAKARAHHHPAVAASLIEQADLNELHALEIEAELETV